MTRRAIGFLAIVAAALVTGCDAGEPDREPVDAPPVHLVEVVASGVDSSAMAIDDVTLAQDGSTKNVATTTAFRLRFDRFLLPSTAIRQALCIQPVGPVATLDDCSPDKGRIFFGASYDPTRRELTLVQTDGNAKPAEQLAPDTRYQLTMLVPAADGCDPAAEQGIECFGVRAFDGAAIENAGATPLVYQFTTSADTPAGTEVEGASTEDYYCNQACFGDDCATGVSALFNTCASGAACHGPAAVKDTPTGEYAQVGPAEGLDLRTYLAVNGTAIGHVAHQTQTGEHADDPDRAPLRFGRAMPIIDPGNPGNSYMLYKMLVSPRFAAQDAETQRLYRSLVVGLPMSPNEALDDPPTNVPRISAWIAQGAQTRQCP